MGKERRQFVKGKESHDADYISSDANKNERNEMATVRPYGTSGYGRRINKNKQFPFPGAEQAVLSLQRK